MKKFLPVIFCLSVIFSCEKETLVEAPVYEFQKIGYFLSDDSKMKVDTIPYSLETITNNSSVSQSAAARISPNFDVSCFLTDNKIPAVLVVDQSVKIAVPTSIDGNNIVTGASLWNYSDNGQQQLPSSVPDYNATYYADAHTKLTITVYEIWKSISVGYVATFVDLKTGETLEIQGRWNGSLFEGFCDQRVQESIGPSVVK